MMLLRVIIGGHHYYGRGNLEVLCQNLRILDIMLFFISHFFGVIFLKKSKNVFTSFAITFFSYDCCYEFENSYYIDSP